MEIKLLIWLIISYGMSNILVYGSIFNTPRQFINVIGNTEGFPLRFIFKFISDLISCMMCTSTWVGFFLSLTFFSPTNTLFGTNEWYSIFLDGLLASGSVWALNSVIEWFEQNRPSNN